MININQFAVQNYIVTPTALVANQNPPQNANLQKWHIILSGVAIANLKCSNNNGWFSETLHIFPDIRTPIQYAINNFSVKIPENILYASPGDGHSIVYLLNVEQYTIISTIGSIFDNGTAVNAGFQLITGGHYLLKV